MARWQEIAYKVGVFWLLIPAAVGAIGYFSVVLLTPKAAAPSGASSRLEPPVKQPASREPDKTWTMPNPPQVDISVEKVEEEVEPPKAEEEAPPIEIAVPEGEEADEASVGGFATPPPAPEEPAEGNGGGSDSEESGGIG